MLNQEYNSVDNVSTLNEGTKEEQFVKIYNIPFERLKNQSDTISTNDGCIHYLDIQTNQIYSYEFFSNRWIQQNKHHQGYLLEALFN